MKCYPNEREREREESRCIFAKVLASEGVGVEENQMHAYNFFI